jgi:hypothetical protein
MTLFLGLIFGAVGGIYFFVGRRTQEPLYLVAGVALMVFPYFVSNVLLTFVIGIALAAVPIGRTRGWY